ncbi:MAG TPA: disulfide oxidoreductase [Acidimicrobiia bacterium]|nr:disulfide oxidoreductase [Acidimicrobiia bacterium]
MSIEATNLYNIVLAMLSLVALAAALGLVIYRMAKGPEAAYLLGDKAIWLAWVVALVATVGSLIYSEVIHFVPCRLCWFQRIAMYPLAIILLVGAIRREAVVKYYALPLALIGLAISIYHNVIQFYPSLEGGSCDPLNPCSARNVEVFGFLDIPFMAGAGFILISVLLALYVKTGNNEL